LSVFEEGVITLGIDADRFMRRQAELTQRSIPIASLMPAGCTITAFENNLQLQAHFLNRLEHGSIMRQRGSEAATITFPTPIELSVSNRNRWTDSAGGGLPRSVCSRVRGS
jgi:hypothetical protein